MRSKIIADSEADVSPKWIRKDLEPRTEAPEASDDALAELFRIRHGKEWRFAARWNCWMRWDGLRWARDEISGHIDAIRRVCREAALRCDRLREGQRIASQKTVAAVERLARTDPAIAVPVSEWDRDPMLLNTPGGVVDLRTGETGPSYPSYMMTRIAGATPSGPCPTWDAFIAQVTGGDRAMAAYLRRIGGYCLTGSTAAQVLFFLYGSGANGKSVFLRALGAVLGDYAAAAPLETFMASGGDRHTTELAGLQGARMVSVAETEVGRQWAESRLKVMTGGESIRVNFMRQDHFEYTPTYKLIVAGNHKPGMRSTDEAMRRRVQLVPFSVTVPPEDRDPRLFEKLVEERNGIMAWALEGCLEWQRIGLAPPPSVARATNDYFDEEDIVGDWLRTCCQPDPSGVTPSKELYTSWLGFAQDRGHPAGTATALSQNLLKRGLRPGRTRSGARAVVGLSLVQAAQTQRKDDPANIVASFPGERR